VGLLEGCAASVTGADGGGARAVGGANGGGRELGGASESGGVAVEADEAVVPSDDVRPCRSASKGVNGGRKKEEENAPIVCKARKDGVSYRAPLPLRYRSVGAAMVEAESAAAVLHTADGFLVRRREALICPV
jgi:hypothetical protein